MNNQSKDPDSKSTDHFPQIFSSPNQIINSSLIKWSESFQHKYQDNKGITNVVLNEEDDKIVTRNSSFHRNNNLRFGIQDISNSNADLLEEIEDLKINLSNIPEEYAEKSFFILQYVAELKQARLVVDEEFYGYNIKKEFKKLIKRINREKIQVLFPDLKQSLSDVKGFFYDKEWKLASKLIKKLIGKIRNLNIQEILRRVRKRQNYKELDARQSLIFFFGESGVGKSTLLHWLSGSEMARDDFSGHIYPYKINNEDSKKITVSASSKSETKDVTFVRVNFSDVKGSRKTGKTVLGDSPGFNDTAGTEANIANKINIQNAIHQSECVILVRVISYLEVGDKLEGLKKRINFFKEMFPDAQPDEFKDHLKSIQYLFTKYPKDKRDEIHNSIKTLIKDMSPEERADENFVAIIQDMLEKTKKDKLMVIDPVEDKNPGYILDKIAETRPIECPNKVNFPFHDDSKNAMEDQIKIYRALLMNALSISDFTLFKYRLKDLKKLKKLKDKWIENKYLECLKSIEKHIIEIYKQEVEKINWSMREENTLIEKDVEEYKTANCQFLTVKNSKDLEISFDDDLDLVKNLESQIDNLLQNLEIKKLGDNGLIKSTYNKMKLISKYLPELEAKCQTFEMRVDDLLEKACETCSELFSTDRNEEGEVELTKINDFVFNLEDLQTFPMITNKYQNLQQQLLNLSKLDSILPKFGEFTQKDIENINSEITRLEKIWRIFEQAKHLSKEEAQSARDSCAKKLLADFGKIADKEMKSISEMQEPLNQVRLLRQVSIIQNKAAIIYDDLMGKLRNLTREVPKEIASYLKNHRKTSVYQIKKLLSMVSKNKWIDEFEEELSSKVLGDIQEEISNYYSNLKSSLDSFLMNPEIEKWVQKAFKLFKIIDEMVCLEETLPGLEKNRQEIIKLFSDKIISYLGQIKHLLDQYSQVKSPEIFEFKEGEKSQLEQFLRYLEVAKDIPQLVERPFRIQNELKGILEGISKEFRHSISQNFQKPRQIISKYRYSLVSEDFDGSQDQNSQVQESICKMYNCVKEVLDIQFQFPHLEKIFDCNELLKQWRRDWTDDYDEISENLNMLQSGCPMKDLEKMLQLAKVLRKLDHFFPENQYRILFSNHHRELPKRIREKKQEFIEALKAFDYENAARVMEDLQANPGERLTNQIINHKYIQRELKYQTEDHIQNRMKQIEDLVNSLRYENSLNLNKIEVVVENLGKLPKISSLLISNLDSAISQKLEDHQTRMKKSLQKNLQKNFEMIKSVLNRYDFERARSEKDCLKAAVEALQVYLPEGFETKFVNEIKDLEKDKLGELDRKYTNLNIFDCHRYPPKKFLKIFDGLPDSDTQKLRRDIEQKIQSAFEKEIGQVQDPQSTKLKSIGQTIDDCLPENLAGSIKIMLYNHKDKLDTENKLKLLEVQKNKIAHENKKIQKNKIREKNKKKKFPELGKDSFFEESKLDSSRCRKSGEQTLTLFEKNSHKSLHSQQESQQNFNLEKILPDSLLEKNEDSQIQAQNSEKININDRDEMNDPDENYVTVAPKNSLNEYKYTNYLVDSSCLNSCGEQNTSSRNNADVFSDHRRDSSNNVKIPHNPP